MKELTVALGERSYPIYIGAGILRNAGVLLKQAGLSLVSGIIVTDSNVGPLYADQLNAALGWSQAPCMLPAGEESKRLAQVEHMCGRFLEAGLDRGSLIVALGGGVVGDMAGFAAACFMRGVRCVQIPTTIVAQVDSSVGGKTGVNHALGKNTIGAFHQPSAVVMDLSLLQTLPDRELRAGLAEAIKHGVIADPDLFDYLETEAPRVLARDFEALERPILRSCAIKAAIVAADEKEHGQRANLNYGHTFGHAIETVSGYGMFLHGEALSLGMHAAGVLAKELGLVDDAFVRRQRACLAMYGLPVQWPEIPVEETLRAMRHDKKARAGTLKFIVADGMGSVVQRTDVTDAQARKALEALRAERV
jgi:3-dehydroquinate synthase